MDVLLKLLAEIRKTKDNVVLVSFYRQVPLPSFLSSSL